MPMPTQTSMDAARTVVVTAYQELPRRRSGSHGASSSRTRSASGGYNNRRAMLLAYAQHLRRRGGQRSSCSGPPRVLEWGEWKRADDPGAGAGNDDKVVAGRRRGCCARLRLWARIWIRTFFRRVRRIRENASCRKAD
ncbi:hypothetical protein CFC21_056373 [Triticum aestivum]|uniref:Uncharacterized protein n=2 Tax=Triticum aestivum TaxID=4565 RepID=A0A9R1KB14_WHEAT|nr:uncharacterized protein LOC123094328 [Triticum aestivum]KAF7047440.1 hypothetical protein CFC21_056373 [Triticum aestivum]